MEKRSIKSRLSDVLELGDGLQRQDSTYRLVVATDEGELLGYIVWQGNVAPGGDTVGWQLTDPAGNILGYVRTQREAKEAMPVKKNDQKV